MNNNKKILLKVRGLNKMFYSKDEVINAVNNVSFNLYEGEILGLIGESGSGKSTLGNCLIRIYENFSGIVTLGDTVISGKHLTQSNKEILNKNVQMIFQDPHASINPQKNVFNILKEPLIINNVMSKEYKDIFKDWNEIISNFKLSFMEKVEKIKLENIKFENDNLEKFISMWKEKVNNFSFEDMNLKNMVDHFDEMYSFLDAKQKRNSIIINKLFDNNERLLNYFFEKQKAYRNNESEIDEIEFEEAKKNLTLTIEFSKKSLKKYLSEEELKKLKEKLATKKINKKNEKINIKNLLDSFSQEFKFDFLKYQKELEKTPDPKKYIEKLKFYFLYKKVYIAFHKSTSKLLFLKSKDVDNLVAEYKEDILKTFELVEKLAIDKFIKHSKLKEVIFDLFKFNFNNHISISKKNETEIEGNLNELQKEIEDITTNLDESDSSHKTKVDVEKAKERYFSSKDEYDWSLKNYKIDFEKRMHELNKEMIIQKDVLSKKINKINDIIFLFKEKYKKEFKTKTFSIMKLANLSKQKINEKQNFFDLKIKEKFTTLKTFDIEIKNLNNDLEKILFLLGIKKNSQSKMKIKNILLKNKIYSTLEEVGLLRQFAWRYPHEFSGGQRQRIVIARALISNPKLIIADEPIASLDISIQAQIVNLLKDLCVKKNVSLIFIAHDLTMVEYIADYICIMHLGKIVESGKTKEIYSKPFHPYTKNLFNAVPRIENANEEFEASSFELDYLKIQNNSNCDIFKYNEQHYIYSTYHQFKKWTKTTPKLSSLSHQKSIESFIDEPVVKINNSSSEKELFSAWSSNTEEETLLIDVTKEKK